jgi:hypothetical protein
MLNNFFNVGFTKLIRSQPIHLTVSNRVSKDASTLTRTFGEFYLMVASALGLSGATLCPQDKCIIHDILLPVM